MHHSALYSCAKSSFTYFPYDISFVTPLVSSQVSLVSVLLRPSPKSRADACICHPHVHHPHSIFTHFYTVLYHSDPFSTVPLCSTAVCTHVYVPTINTAILCTLVPIFCNLTCPSSPIAVTLSLALDHRSLCLSPLTPHLARLINHPTLTPCA